MLAGEQVCAARGCFIGMPRPLFGQSLVDQSWPGGSPVMFDAIVERLLAQSALTVMARVVLRKSSPCPVVTGAA